METHVLDNPFGPFEFHRDIEPVLGIKIRRVRQLANENRIIEKKQEGGWFIVCPKLQKKALRLQNIEIIEEGRQEKEPIGKKSIEEPTPGKAEEFASTHLVTKAESMVLVERAVSAESEVKNLTERVGESQARTRNRTRWLSIAALWAVMVTISLWAVDRQAEGNQAQITNQLQAAQLQAANHLKEVGYVKESVQEYKKREGEYRQQNQELKEKVKYLELEKTAYTSIATEPQPE